MSRRSRVPLHVPDTALVIATLLLAGLGLVMVLSASAIPDLVAEADPYATARPQLLAVAIGVAGAAFIAFLIPSRLIRLLAPLIYLATIALVLAVNIPGFGIEVAGSARWLKLPGLPPIHPAEFAKLGVAVGIASLASWRRDGVRSFFGGTVPVLALAGLPAGIVLLAPDLGTASILLVGGFAGLLFAGGRIRDVAFLIGAGLAGAVAVLTKTSYQQDRITAWLDPWSDPLGIGYHSISGYTALARGGITGVGLGQGKQAASLMLPNSANDYIIAVIGEELGLIGVVVVGLLFAVLVYRTAVIASHAPDRFGAVLVATLGAMIGFQAGTNIGVVTGFVPTTGIPLPLVSAGGSSALVTLLSIGLMLRVSREAGAGFIVAEPAKRKSERAVRRVNVREQRSRRIPRAVAAESYSPRRGARRR